MPFPRRAVVVLALLLGLLPPRSDADEEAPSRAEAPLAPTSWLVLDPVDRRSRRPFNPDAVFARHLLDRDAPPPRAGDTLRGEREQEERWTEARPDAEGWVGGRPISTAYARLDLPEAQVRLARLTGGARLYVNGCGHVGDVYGSGFGGVPVALRKGVNHLYVRGVRGRFRLQFDVPPARCFIASWGRTVPDLVAGEPTDAVAGVVLVNASTAGIRHATVFLEGREGLADATVATTFALPPLGALQVRLPIRTRGDALVPEGRDAVALPLAVGWDGAEPVVQPPLTLSVRRGTDALLRTFVSGIDDSVQGYALRRPAPGADPATAPGLVLTLHGAGVQPRNQAGAYATKPDFWIVAPTNRRPFGFDWQDWGRLDAYEVLADALRHTGVERNRVYLTGHSMGGHGSWHLAANDPDGFAAVAPSAGWVSFDSYAGGRVRGPLTSLWHAADGASDTLSLIDNLRQVPTFILHGTADDNVPIQEAHTMAKALRDAGAAPQVHYEEGAGHWWDGDPAAGARCVDWPGIFELFRAHRIPESPSSIRFRGVDPAVDSRHHWLEVRQVRTYGEPFAVTADAHPPSARIDIRTTNVRHLVVHRAKTPKAIVIDGTPVPTADSGPIHLVWRESGGWTPSGSRARRVEKTPARSGPFKRAFGRRFVFVYGTQGTEEENRELLERARFDAWTWLYRGNGQTIVLADAAYLEARASGAMAGRNVILYGNGRTNAAAVVLDPRVPIRPARRHLFAFGESWVGEDLAAVFLYPQRDETDALVGVFADTGVTASRLGYTLLPFVSGVGYPDYVLFDDRVLHVGDGGVLGAGFFDHAWRQQPGGYREGGALKPAK